jgi:hypothetical protein
MIKNQIECEARDDPLGSIWQTLEKEYRSGMIVIEIG